MKHKAKVRRRREVPIPASGEMAVEPSSPPATPGRSSIEQVDEHKAGSIESVSPTVPENGVAGFIEPAESDAEGARSRRLQPEP